MEERRLRCKELLSGLFGNEQEELLEKMAVHYKESGFNKRKEYQWEPDCGEHERESGKNADCRGKEEDI